MAGFDENEDHKKECVVLVAVLGKQEAEGKASLEELKELVKTAGAVSVGTLIQRMDEENNATYLGKGKLEELKTMLVALNATGIVCDTELSAVQMRNLTRKLEVKVMDRTMVILDIFASRAKTKEGKIQVELAQLKYNSTMLVGLRDSLSRLGGGIGTRGPGEKKLEMDRRLIREQITRLKHELEKIKLHRQTQRKGREKSGIPVACIVGYTNAGKSTLLNSLTRAGVFSEDKLFATLDPTTRMLKLPEGQKVMLTDTVGFISNLPHHLIQAFHSTLEEAKYSDIILHVVDVSNPEADRQMYAVYETLKRLEIGDKPIITVFNKIDKAASIPLLKDLQARAVVYVSAKQGTGMDKLMQVIADQLREKRIYVERILPYTHIKMLDEIRNYGELLAEEYREEGIFIRAYVRRREAERLKNI